MHALSSYRRNRLTHTSDYAANTYESTKRFEYIRTEMNIQHCSAGPALVQRIAAAATGAVTATWRLKKDPTTNDRRGNYPSSRRANAQQRRNQHYRTVTPSVDDAELYCPRGMTASPAINAIRPLSRALISSSAN